jgi:hypothetical protein
MEEKSKDYQSTMGLNNFRNNMSKTHSIEYLNRTLASSHDSNSDTSSRSPSPNNRSVDSLCLNVEYDTGKVFLLLFLLVLFL